MGKNNYEAMDLAVKAAKQWLNGLDERPVAATASLNELREKLAMPLEAQGRSANQVIEDLIESTKGGILGSAGGRFFAWVIGGSVPSALAADWLTSTWDQNAALYACGPAASVIEEVAGEWIKEILHLPKSSSFAFTTGCQLAHFTCLASARSSVLRKVGWNINNDGLCGAPPIRVLTSEHRHASVDRAVRYLGLGNRSLQSLPTDKDGRIGLKTFEDSLKKSSQPTIIVLNAADLNIASFDPFDEIIPVAKASGAWVHIDGAFGLFARASDKLRHLTKGVDLADSWATDGHKWLNVPFDCGIAIIRDQIAHREAMTISAPYISAETQARDQIDWNPEWSRRARGIPVYAALRELGKDGVADLVERSSRHCRTIVTEIGKLPGAEILWEPQLNQGLIRFLDLNGPMNEDAHNKKTDEIISAVNADGEAFFSSTTWQGKRAMRVSVVNWRTNEEDIEKAIRSVSKILKSFTVKVSVENIIKQYVQGADKRNVKLLEEVFHDKFQVIALTKDGVRAIDKKAYLELITTGKIGGNSRELKVLDISNDGIIGTAKITLTGKDSIFNDYLTLINEDGKWSIVSNVTRVISK